MRLWLVDPRIMCRQHLLGEHVECHAFVGTINKGVRVKGYLRDNLLQINMLVIRHEELAEEMKSRGYNHKSPLPELQIRYNDPTSSLIPHPLSASSAAWSTVTAVTPDCILLVVSS